MKPDAFEEDPIWDLLGKLDDAKPVEVSPLFARNVVREIRLANGGSRTRLSTVASFFRNLCRNCSPVPLARLAFIAAAVAGILCLNVAVLLQDHESSSVALQHPVDVEVINHLDELLANEDTSVWLDNSSD